MAKKCRYDSVLNDFFLEAINTMETTLYYRVMLYFETTLQNTVVLNILLFFLSNISLHPRLTQVKSF